MSHKPNLAGCIDPSGVEVADIPAYIAGDGRANFVTHINNCTFCQSEADQYRTLEQQFSLAMKPSFGPVRADCPEVQLLGELALKLIVGKESKKIESHIKGCTFCTTEFSLLSQELAIALPEFEAVTQTDTILAKLRRVVATLTTARPEMIMRSSGSAESYAPRDYEAEDITIILRVQPVKLKKDLFTVMGTTSRLEHTPDEYAGSEVRLLQGEDVLAIETLDETGSFFFENIANVPDLNLEVQLADKIVVVSVEF
jgi:hypothetical protein